jgi:hypothetical protein
MINNREVEGILWDQNTDYPMFRAKEPCASCAKKGLDCFLASRGSLISGCTCCISLYNECSFTHDQMPKGFRPTFAGIAEDEQICHGSVQEATRNMRSFDDAKGRKAGSRFPRDAVKILKKWLSEHASHPYPNEREKEELKQLTGLRKSQIANWLANARRRGKVTPASGPSSPMLGAIDIPNVCPDKMADLGPLDRWKASPPEHEAALMTDIARAITTAPMPRNASASSLQNLQNSRASSRKASSEDDSNWSAFRAPSVSSFETRESSNSDFSFASSRSQQSKASRASSLERRRRRRAPMTQKAVAQAAKPRSARIFQCTFCADAFPAKYDWQRHEKSLHLALERWTCCPEGGIISTQSGEQKCAFCPELNPSTEHLETHNFATCQEKNVQERTFFRKDHLRQHLKLMHDAKFNPAMENWKTTNNEIKSKCGFCPSRFTTWQQRADHLAAHFKNGSDMSQWTGRWGFEPHIEKIVENAIPPYLIGHERSSMNPWIARGESGTTHAFSNMWIGTPEDSYQVKSNQIARDSSCWGRGERELINFVSDQLALGNVPTDRQLQDHARMVIYGDPDPLDWTFADSPTWLEAFKYQVGIGPAPADENIQGTVDVPIMPPYVVKGGLKTKCLAESCPTLEGVSSQTSPQDECYGFPPAQDLDPAMDIDFSCVDFQPLDLDGLGDMSFDESFIAESLGVGSAEPIQHKSSLGYFDPSHGKCQPFPDQNQQLMSEQDLSQLTKYMAGFP